MKAATVSVGVNEEKIEEYEEDDDGSFTRMSSEDVVFNSPCSCGCRWGTSDWGEAPVCDRCGCSHPWSNVEGWNPEGN